MIIVTIIMISIIITIIIIITVTTTVIITIITISRIVVQTTKSKYSEKARTEQSEYTSSLLFFLSLIDPTATLLLESLKGRKRERER